MHVVQPGDDQFSFFHVKTFTLHNHLYINPYKPNNVYYIDKCYKVHKVTFSPLNHEIVLEEVFKFSSLYNYKKGDYNTSIIFPSADIAVICNGAGMLYLARINEIEGKEIWETLKIDCLCEDKIPCVLCDARIEKVDTVLWLHVVLLHIKENTVKDKSDTKPVLFQTVLEWRTFIQTNCNYWNQKYLKKLSINGFADYVALEPGCRSILIVCDQTPQWISDSENPLPQKENFEDSSKLMPSKIYTWMQNDKEIHFWLAFEENIKKDDLNIFIDDVKIEIKLKDKQLVSGEFYKRVDKDLNVWLLEKNKLEIQLTKLESGVLWTTFLMNDDKGQEIMDTNNEETFQDKLNMCSTEEESGLTTFNIQQLEECDVGSDSLLLRLDAENHLITHKVNLSSSKWLFKIYCNPTQTPAICCRHDVDACVWQFKECREDEKTWPHEHIGTFSAFGYVQASKTQKKFIVSPPNLSYVVICDMSHHIYIYRQPSFLSSELKNRHTGKKVKTISKQQLVNLETNEEILGVQAGNSFLYVLLQNSLCVLTMNV